jgi:hypothetical protein
MARPTQYRPEFAPQARRACRYGMDNAGLARVFSVSPATLYRWLNRYPDFAAATAAGKAEADNRTTPSRFQRAIGYDIVVERTFAPRGAGGPVILCHRRRVLADPKVALRWLRNRRPERWTLDDRASATAARNVRIRLGHARISKVSGSDSHNPGIITEKSPHAPLALCLPDPAPEPHDIAISDSRFLPLADRAGKVTTGVPSHIRHFTDDVSTRERLFTSARLSPVSLEPDRLERPGLDRPPQPPLIHRQDQPQRPIPHRLRRIPRGGHGRAAWMRMIMADRPGPACPHRTIRREQRRRVDLERPRRALRHIRARFGCLDPPVRAEQQPANLRVRGIFRLG